MPVVTPCHSRVSGYCRKNGRPHGGVLARPRLECAISKNPAALRDDPARPRAGSVAPTEPHRSMVPVAPSATVASSERRPSLPRSLPPRWTMTEFSLTGRVPHAVSRFPDGQLFQTVLKQSSSLEALFLRAASHMFQKFNIFQNLAAHPLINSSKVFIN